MPPIAAGRFVRYADRQDLTDVVCPPYDIIDEAGRTALEAKSPHNFVRLILPREMPGDGPLDRYVRARDTISQWTGEGVLARDAEPSIFAVEQSFTDLMTGERRVRRGIQSLLKLHEFSEGVVLPHERTLSGPKADRLELMKAVQAHLSPIFILYPDETNSVLASLADVFNSPPTNVAEAAGATHRAWRITDPKRLAVLTDLIAPRKGYIADGHHRYETALKFRQLAREQGRKVDGTPLDYVPAFLCSMSDPGLVIFPTHRLVHSMDFDALSFESALLRFFTATTLTEEPGELERPESLRAALRTLASKGKKAPSFLLYGPYSMSGTVILTLRDNAPLDEVKTLPSAPSLRRLDVALLHSVIFEHILHMSRQSQERQEHLRYEKDAAQSIARVRKGEAQFAIIMNPTKMEQVREVSEAGEVMPQKSTYFYPKIIDGLGVQLLDGESI